MAENENAETELKVEVDDAEESKQAPAKSNEATNLNLTFADMWEQSFLFRVVITGGLCLFLAILLGLALVLSSTRYESERVDIEKAESDRWYDICSNCSNVSEKQQNTIQDLNQKISDTEASIIQTQEKIKSLNERKGKLTNKLDEVKAEVAAIKSSTILWQALTAGGGLLGIAGGGYGIHANSKLKKCVADSEEVQKKVNVQQIILEQIMGPGTNYAFMKKQGYWVEHQTCFDSSNSKFDKLTLMESCTNYKGPGVIFELKNDAGITFGAYIKKELTQDTTYIEDPDAFVFVLTNGTLALIKPGAKAFSFTADQGKLFVIGNDEITVKTSTEDTTDVETNPGVSFDFFEGARPYHPNLNFKVTSLVVHKMVIHHSA